MAGASGAGDEGLEDDEDDDEEEEDDELEAGGSPGFSGADSPGSAMLPPRPRREREQEDGVKSQMNSNPSNPLKRMGSNGFGRKEAEFDWDGTRMGKIRANDIRGRERHNQDDEDTTLRDEMDVSE